jgi:hypothetical protein
MSQPNNCILKEPLAHIHFGQGNVRDINTSPLPNYYRVTGSCPTDGHYSFSAFTPGCFHGDWFDLTEDHTPGDENGNMMLVNANPAGGVFLTCPIKGLRGNATYEFAVWVMNLCRLYICCSHLSPTIQVLLTTKSGKKITGFLIGDLVQTETSQWRRYKGFFTMPAGENEVVLTMLDNAIGGCGNDFALDDITIRECIPPVPPITVKSKVPPPSAVGQQTSPAKPVVKKGISNKPLVTTKEKPVIVAKTKKDSIKNTTPLPVPKPEAVPLPLILQTRANPLVKQLQTVAGEIRLDLYDNGEIDGDTISIYHNNELLISKARLSQKPVSFSIMVDALHPHHELVMVANNLGSIPPNTSLMIVTTKDQRYQVFISSSEQKNAKLIIDLKE